MGGASLTSSPPHGPSGKGGANARVGAYSLLLLLLLLEEEGRSLVEENCRCTLAWTNVVMLLLLVVPVERGAAKKEPPIRQEAWGHTSRLTVSTTRQVASLMVVRSPY
jgi:hypothetical protein